MCFKTSTLTQTFQINDARQLPIVIPTEQQRQTVKELFDSAIATKKQEFASMHFDAKSQLNNIQHKLDIVVNNIYGI